MKKYAMLLGCLLLFGTGLTSARADDAAPSKPRNKPLFGLEGGINLATLRGLQADQVVKSRLGFVGGAFLSFPMGTTLSLQPELLYSQKGGKINGLGYQLDYVEVPVLLDIQLGGPGIVPGILAGPAFNSAVSNEGVLNVKRSDVGLVLGVQWILSKFLVSGRYEVGLNDVSSDSSVKNGTFTFLVGFSIL